MRWRKLSPFSTSPRGEGKTRPRLVRLAREQLPAQDTRGGVGEVDAAARGAGLHRHELTLVGTVLDLHGQGRKVDVAVAEREELALPQTGERGEQHHVAVGSDGIGGDVLDLVPVEEAHLGLVAARRLQPEDALVDEVAALLRVREHLLEHAKRQLGLTGSAARECRDVILDYGRPDLVERDRAEYAEVRQHLADACER